MHLNDNEQGLKETDFTKIKDSFIFVEYLDRHSILTFLTILMPETCLKIFGEYSLKKM